jgi:transposase|tara:strand:+ start:1908 stop:2087 length:180 start_codon:yes stop_codon:yes gene_type:complete
LRAWCKRTELTQENSSVNLSEHERLKQLERENTELKRAKEILRKAVAFFAQAELNRKPN